MASKSYDGCAGGRLYSGKNRDEVEREVKEALENPAPPPVKGAPVLGTPETSESGDTVIPDAFCDWTYRRKQAQALMNKSQGTRLTREAARVFRACYFNAHARDRSKYFCVPDRAMRAVRQVGADLRHPR